MGYLIELSVDVNKITNISGIKKALFDKAEECNVERYYSFYEFMGKNRKIYRNHCVLSFTFEEYEELIIHFINYVKTFSGVNIESLGYDQLVFKLMYASRKYLRLKTAKNIKSLILIFLTMKKFILVLVKMMYE